MASRRLVVAITGASGAVYGLRLLQVLQVLRADPDRETHLVMSASGAFTVAQEIDLKRTEIEALADVVHNV
jgi:2,5-furandicarboxylate decarboxylase 2